MKQHVKWAGLAILTCAISSAALAQDKIKVGVIVTLSGPAAVLGQRPATGSHLR